MVECYIIRFDPEENKFYCVVSDKKVVYGLTYEECKQEVESHADQNVVDMYFLRRGE